MKRFEPRLGSLILLVEAAPTFVVEELLGSRTLSLEVSTPFALIAHALRTLILPSAERRDAEAATEGGKNLLLLLGDASALRLELFAPTVKSALETALFLRRLLVRLLRVVEPTLRLLLLRLEEIEFDSESSLLRLQLRKQLTQGILPRNSAKLVAELGKLLQSLLALLAQRFQLGLLPTTSTFLGTRTSSLTTRHDTGLEDKCAADGDHLNM